MKVAEFAKLHKRCQHLVALRMLQMICVLFALLGMAYWIQSTWSQAEVKWLPVVMIMSGIPIMLSGCFLADQAYKKFPGLTCKHCCGCLFISKSTVISTGNCPNCGRQVLKDEQIGT